MRRLAPPIVAFLALLALWPAVCMSAEDGPTSCSSALMLPLPWGDSADTWGMAVAVLVAAAAYVTLRRLLRRPPTDAP